MIEQSEYDAQQQQLVSTQFAQIANSNGCTIGLQLQQAVCSKTIAMFLLATPYEKRQLIHLLYKRCKHAFTDTIMYFK